MKRSQLAAQLFTLRDFIKTPEDVVKTFEKVRDIGYQAVQVSAMAAQIEEEDLAKLAADYGLTICATHEPGKLICEETDKVIDRLKRLNCRYTAYPHPHVPVETKEQVMALAEQLKVAAEKMQQAGLTLCYHNHAIEFERFDGELMLDLLYNNAPAMQAEIDTFWVQAGGQDPVSWINRFPGKQPLLHLKEFGIINRERKMLAIGNGNLDWKSIIAAGTACGVEYFIVEQDDCNGVDPFEEMRRSYNFIAENFFD